MNRIFCLGNGLWTEDQAGPMVHDALLAMPKPAGTEATAAGLAGLDLVWLAEGCARVVFVDQLRDWPTPGEVVLLDPEAVAASSHPTFGHAAGLPWLLRALPAVATPPPSQIHVIGLAPPLRPAAIRRAARMALALAAAGGGRC